MVFFTCNTCGTSLKKNQVLGHTYKCRCPGVSCMDCGKDFWGDEYNSHTKCITEDEKYSGKNYVPKLSANKAQQKQDEIKKHISELLESNNKLEKNVKSTLGKLLGCPNIPRKKNKFENFMKSFVITARKDFVTAQVWQLISEAVDKSSAQQNNTKKQVNPEKDNKDKDNQSSNEEPEKDYQNDTISENVAEVNSEKKKNKKDRHNNVDMPDNSSIPDVNGSEEKGKKKKKRDHRENSEKIDSSNIPEISGGEEKIRKKRKKEQPNEPEFSENANVLKTDGNEKKKNKKSRKDKELEFSGTSEVPKTENNGVEVEDGMIKKKRKVKSENEISAEIATNGAAKDKKSRKEIPEIEKRIVDAIDCTSKDKKRKLLDEDQENCETTTDVNAKVKKSKKDSNKFSWTDAIISILNERENHEISLKKLRKKADPLYNEFYPDQPLNKEDFIAILRKKVERSSKLEFNEEYVKLVS